MTPPFDERVDRSTGVKVNGSVHGDGTATVYIETVELTINIDGTTVDDFSLRKALGGLVDVKGSIHEPGDVDITVAEVNVHEGE